MSLLGWPEPGHSAASWKVFSVQDRFECVADSVKAVGRTRKPLRRDEDNAGVWDYERGETSKIPDVLGDDTTIVASRPSQYVVVGMGSQANLNVEYGQHVVAGVSQTPSERRWVHLVEENAGYDFRCRRLC
jgi:hypothetical protein